MSDFIIACVGKPSAGKSSFLNAVTDATAKVGNYPFTTIEPNQGIAYYPTTCPCKRYNISEYCKPKYGWCDKGERFLPIKMIDVAGLVPGASEGRGLGNRFLDDLRHADVLIHIVDSSGTTDENGKVTKGYDPTNDIEWLRSEIHAWIFNNMNKKWDSTVRRHIATKSTSANTLQSQLSGYGANKDIVMNSLGSDYSKLPLNEWKNEDLYNFVFRFIDVRFPTVIALNKIDHPDSDTNITRIIKRYTQANKNSMKLNSDEESVKSSVHGVNADRIVLTSALSECYLKLLEKQKYILYKTGDEDFTSLADDPSLSDKLVSFDSNVADELERIRDLVLYRYFSTGTQQTIVKAVESLGMIPVYPVKKIPTILPANSASGDSSNTITGKDVFRDAMLVKSGTTVRQFAEILGDDFARNFNGAETIGNMQLGEDDVIVPGKNNIISIKTKYSSIKSTNKSDK
ncbi:putative GTP-binding protein [Smittium culicis]|uniref:Putative GTP-binding protein n=1 Tax=Smittium culicis TaxID=133412 RepID=A0A1R1XLM7_9FUNG|nr:putative GTP-binding protein [Smittium culicis]OMJ18554.1 putative GTP-binding protein [Smittium culicis]